MTIRNGYITVSVNDEKVSELYKDLSVNVFGLKENEYVAIYDDENTLVDKYKWQDGTHKKIYSRPIDSLALGKIRPKNTEQRFAIDMLMDESITVKIMAGPWGSGKSFLSSACALDLINKGKYDKIVWIRNNIELADTNSIGYLKGTFQDKMIVWAMPLADHLGGEDELVAMEEKGQLELQHLGFARGRDIKHALIFCTEAEHLTRKQVQFLLTRVSEGSCLILEGDCKQIDAKAFKDDNGLEAAIHMLAGQRLVGFIRLNECVRSETAKLADLMDV